MVRTNTCPVLGDRAQLAEVAKRRDTLIGAETGQFRATLVRRSEPTGVEIQASRHRKRRAHVSGLLHFCSYCLQSCFGNLLIMVIVTTAHTYCSNHLTIKPNGVSTPKNDHILLLRKPDKQRGIILYEVVVGVSRHAKRN